jgi:benzylsuccinate CoA-transferase BbsF subunit
MANAALHGLGVVDMGWLMAGPETARYLGDLGAVVIKVESHQRRDPLRAMGPFKYGVPGVNRSMSYHAINAGKRSLTLNIKVPAGREVVLRLTRWADVFIEAFTPGVADGLKLSYKHLSAENPRLIMMSTSVLGASGPDALGTSGTGTTGSAFAGATNVLGWPDREPMGPYGPWTDAVTPRFAASTILAALHRRARTGEGCFIDISQAECGLQFLLPAYLDYAVNGRAPQRRGVGGSLYFCPSGVYPCRGTDRWITIEVTNESQWENLRKIVGGALSEPRFDGLLARLRQRQEIEHVLVDFTADKDPIALERRLQSGGVPAHVVAHTTDLAADEDLKAEGFYRPIRNDEIGEGMTRGPQASLSRTPHVETRPGPRIGDSTLELLREVCGYTSAEIEQLEKDGVLR